MKSSFFSIIFATVITQHNVGDVIVIFELVVPRVWILFLPQVLFVFIRLL